MTSSDAAPAAATLVAPAEGHHGASPSLSPSSSLPVQGSGAEKIQEKDHTRQEDIRQDTRQETETEIEPEQSQQAQQAQQANKHNSKHKTASTKQQAQNLHTTTTKQQVYMYMFRH